MEDLHGDLVLSIVLFLELGVMDGNVRLDVFARGGDLLILPRAVVAHDSPVCNSGRDTSDHQQEQVRLEAPARNNGQEGLHNVWYDQHARGEMDIVESANALCQTD